MNKEVEFSFANKYLPTKRIADYYAITIPNNDLVLLGIMENDMLVLNAGLTYEVGCIAAFSDSTRNGDFIVGKVIASDGKEVVLDFGNRALKLDLESNRWFCVGAITSLHRTFVNVEEVVL